MDNNISQPSPLLPSEMPSRLQIQILLDVFGLSLINSAFDRWQRYRDIHIAGGRTYKSFMDWLAIRLVDGLCVFEQKLTQLETELEKDPTLKL